jgi:hypothetical protein
VATYRVSVKFVGRSAGQSATAAAAYRTGEIIRDARTGDVHDYRRRGEVLHCAILSPADAPDWVNDRESLWNAVEAAEKRKDSQVAREVQLSLPFELSLEANREVVHAFVREQLVARGMIADVAIHGAHRKGDARNIHAHILLSTRSIAPDGFGKKVLEWNSKAILAEWRCAWAEHLNRALERGGISARVDHRSYTDRGIDLEPEPKQGRLASKMERDGKRSHAGDDRRAVKERNDKRRLLRAEYSRLDEDIRDADRGALRFEIRGGSRFADPPRWQADRELALSAEYERDMRGSSLARFWRIERTSGGLQFSNARGLLLDEGYRVSAREGNAVEIRAMLDIAQAKGWHELEVNGNEAFRRAAIRAAVERGFIVQCKGRDSELLEEIQRSASAKMSDRDSRTARSRSAEPELTR